MILYASECVKGNYSLTNLKERFNEVFGEDYDDFILLDMVRPDAEKRCVDASCGAKELLYSDTFLDKFDCTVIGDEGKYFASMEKKFKKAKTASESYSYIFENYEKLCKVMKVKYTLGFRTRNAYEQKNKEDLAIIVKDYTKTIKYIEEFLEYFIKMWFTDSKPHGFDVQDIRLGSVIQRLKSNKQRLQAYIDGQVEAIPELEEKLANIFSEENAKKAPRSNSYALTVTINSL